jgi:hypothetical protein
MPIDGGVVELEVLSSHAVERVRAVPAEDKSYYSE